MPRIVEMMYRNVPTGVGATRRDLKVSRRDLGQILARGARWAIDQGYGWHEQLERIEEAGCLGDANPDLVSERAFERGRPQLGTLGSGNHFAEVQYVSEIYDDRVAQAFGLRLDQITVMLHSGSRGLGHQVCQDHLKIMVNAVRHYGIDLPDRQLSCAPLDSPEGRRYLAAMAAAANFAFANRQVMAHWVRESIAAASTCRLSRQPSIRCMTCATTSRNSKRFPLVRSFAGCVCTEKGRRGRIRQGIHRYLHRIAPWGSRCWCRAIWAATHTCWLEPNAPRARPSGQAVMVRADA